MTQRLVIATICVFALLVSGLSLGDGRAENVKTIFLWNEELGNAIIKEILWDYGDAKLCLGYSAKAILPKLNFQAEKWPYPSSSAKGSHYIVQFIGPVDERWYERLEMLGMKVTPFVLPEYAVVVKSSEESINLAENLPFVYKVIPYEPFYKCTREVLKTEGSIEISIFLYPDADENVMIEKLKEIGDYAIASSTPYWKLIYTKILASKIPWVACQDEVFSVGVHHWPKILNDVAAGIIEVDDARDALLSGLPINLTGRGQIAGVADTGLDTGRNDNTMHADFQGRIVWLGHYNSMPWFDPTSDDSDDIGHGTHVAGSVLGNGKLSSDYAQAHNLQINYSGMAPEAKLVFQKIASDSGYLLGTGSLSQFLEDAYNLGARVHHNSWGSQQNFGAYDDMAVTVDTVMWNHKDYLVSFSAGNSGPSLDTIGSPATAKNCLSVGASKNARPEFGGGSQGADDPTELAGFSSRGPTDDNRIKPDIVSPGTYILSTMSSVETWGIEWASEPYPIMHNYNTNKPAYCFMGGTSMSGPITAGAALLVRQFFTDIKGINPSAALIKATLINGAVNMGYGYPSYHQGWGRTNLKNSLFPDAPAGVVYFDETNGLSTGNQREYTFTIAQSNVPLKITLAWSDYFGSQNANPTLVNNLDLEVYAPDGTTYYRGNQFENNWSKPMPTTFDARNNVENVFIKAPATGTWRVSVKAQNVPQGPQPYALVVSAGFPPSQDYQVSLSTADALQKSVRPGASAMLNLTVLNYGTNQDIIRMSVNQYPGITPAFSENNIQLGSGQSKPISLSFQCDSTLQDGVYDFQIVASSVNNLSKRARLDFKLVVVSLDLPTPTPVTDEAEPQSNPVMAVNGNDVWIAYISKEGDYNNPSVFVKHSADGGNTFAEKWKVSNTPGYCEEPSITLSQTGYVLVAWHADEKYIRANVYVPGQGWKGEKTLRSNTNTYYPISGYASTLIDRNNRFWVFWRDNNLNSQTEVNFDIWCSYSTDYGSTWSAPSALPNSLQQREYMPSACVGNDGNIYLAFYVLNTNRDIYLRRCLVSGNTYTWQDAVPLEDPSVAQQGNDLFPAIFCASDGKIWISWHSDRESPGTYKVYLSYFDGNTWSQALGGFGTSTTSGTKPYIAEKNDVLAVAYVENDNVYGSGNIAVLLSADNFQTFQTRLITADAYAKGHPDIDSNSQNFFVAYYTDTAFTRNDIRLAKFNVSTDLTPPTIQHTPVSQAFVNREINISAQITDNNVVAEAKLHYKHTQESDFKEIVMSGTASLYTAQIPASEVTLDGIDYFISASDGVNTAQTPIYHINVSLPSLYATIICNNSVERDEMMEIRVKVNSSIENGVENALVMLSAEDGGFTEASGYSDVSGEFVTTYIAPSITAEKVVRIYVNATKSGYNDANSFADIKILLPQLSLEILPENTSLLSARSMEVSIKVHCKGNAVAGAIVNLSPSNGTIEPATGSTASDGTMKAKFTAPITITNLTCYISARASAEGYRDGNATIAIAVIGELPEIALAINYTDSMRSGQSQDIEVRTTSFGSALANAYVEVFASTGTVLPSTGYTDSNGTIRITYFAPEVEESAVATLTINVSKSNYKTKTTQINITLLPLPVLSVVLSMNESVEAGAKMEIVIEVKAEGMALQDVHLSLELSPKTGNLSALEEYTDENGRAVIYYNAPQVDSEVVLNITVVASKEGYRDGSATKTFKVMPKPEQEFAIDPYLIAGIILAIGIAIGIVVLLLILRGRKKAVYPQYPMPPQPQYPYPQMPQAYQYPSQPPYPSQPYSPQQPPPPKYP